MVVSAKSFSVPEAVAAYRSLATKIDYPLHIGITESGTLKSGSLRSAIGLGILLFAGIGDTLRVSLSADPIEEVHIARQILQILELRRFQPELVSCPTCARCDIDLIPIANELERRLGAGQAPPLRVAVMGCVVNGPGEARQSDLGIAAGKGKGVLFKKGKIIKNVAEKDFIDEIMKLVNMEKPD